MNNKNNFLSNRLNKYSIRKVSFGTASLLIGATLLFGVNNDAQAAEETTTSSAVTDSQSGEEGPDAVEAPTTESATTENTEEAQQVTPEVETTEAVSEKDVSTEVTEPETVENEADTTEVESATAQQAQEESEEVSNTVETAKETADVTQDTEPVPETKTTAEVSAQDTEVVSEPAQPVSNEVTSAEAPATVEASTTATTGADVPETRYDAALALSEELEKNKEYATATSGTTFRSAFRSVGTTRAATDYTGKIIDYPGDLVVKVDDPTTALAPGNINFAPRFVEGQSKSYAFLVNPDGTITKKSLAVNNGSSIVAYKGNFIELNNNTPEAYVYLSNVGISDGHSVDAIAKVSIIPTKDSDPLNTRYFLTSGRDYLSVASKAGGGASVSLTFLEHKDQADFDNLYNSVQLSQTTKESLLQSLDSIKGETEAVSGLLNVYDLDDYSATKSKDKRKSITFDRDEISKLYVSNETTQRASAILELNGDQVTLTSGPEGKGDTLANNKKVTVTYENQSQLNYTITGTGSSGPAFLPDGLLLLEVPPYHVEDVATTTGQDDQFVIHQTVPMRDVRKPITLPKEITLGVQVPEGVKLSLKENTTSLFTADKSASTSNQLTIVPGKNGVKNLDLLKQQTYYNKIYDMPITASHDLTLADIENNTAKWQQLQQYYDKDEEVLKVPITYTFKNGVETWDDLTTDKPFAVMNVSDEIKNTLRKIDEAAAAVEAAKVADQAAKDALATANTDSLITPTEQAALEAAQQEAVAKKTAATDIVNALPESYRGDMPATLAGLTGINVPAVNDQNENGIEDSIDTQLADAQAKVDAAKAADKAAQDALTAANADGLISQEEADNLADLAKKAADAKTAAETAVSNLPTSPEAVKTQKDTLTNELAGLNGITVPAVNDKDGNGVADDVDAQVEAARQAVEEAKAADKAAKDKLDAANADGLITPTEKAELEAAQQEAQAKKDAATEKVNALPEENKGNLPTELSTLTGINVPEVNDQNENGVDDQVDAQLADTKAKVDAAKAADQAAKDALEKANEDGLITPDEKAELEKLQEEAKSKKDDATDKVNALPEDQKGDLPSELDKLTGIEIPEVNDADANGVADDVDAQRADAEKAVEEAKTADQTAKDALAKAEEDGLITPAEKAELEAAAQEAADKKAAAEDKVNALPEDQKGDLPAELDKLTGIEIPEVNDADANGVADDVDAQRADAEKAVEEAKQADQAAKDALAKANEDGLITPAEKAELEKLQEEAQAKKETATDKVNALPEDQKGDLPSELDKLTGIEVPEVNDSDANGVADDVDAQREDAEKAVEEAKAADQAAKDALAKAEEDGLITPAEKAELEAAQQEAVDKKAAAEEKVNALPEDQKGDLPSELDKLTGIEIPEVNDADANGVADDVDAQRADAEKAVEEAKAADQAAKDALVKANEDGLITPAEKAELEKPQEEAKSKKDEATDKVNALPENQKGDLPSELDKLTGIEIPEVNDADANGVADDVDAQRADAEKAVEEAKEADQAAKEADQAAKDALAKAEEDRLITPAEKAELEAAAQEAADKKSTATEKVNALPEDQKGDLPAELDKLTGIEVPEVNDADSNGVADDVDAQREEAEKAVEEAKAADQAAKDALAKAEEDGLITPAEKAELEKLQEEAQTKKDEATDKVNALPADQRGDLPSELDKLTGIEIPEVNDADSNGVADDIDAQRADAEKAVEEAKQADQAAKDALAKANEDGLITPAEKAELEAAAKEVADKKAAAEEKVNALPENQKGDLPSELDKLTGIEIPEANDADSNGVADDVDAQREEAEKAVEEAKAADQAAKDALAKANEDGLITPAEKAELEKLQEEAQAKKDEATDKVNTLPEDQRGDLPAELDKLTGIEIPEVNDADSNGVADDVDAQREEAEKAVEEAKQADQAAKDALVKAEEDGLITPAEKAELETAAQEAADKKSTATEKVNALPEDQKGDLPAELDKLTGIEIPEVNDADSNDVADDVDAQRADAEKAVEEAKEADQAAKDALQKAQEDGLITPAEKAELEAAAQEAADKKATATDKVNALPENQKGDLPSELDKLTGIEVPEVNDADANGVADNVDAQRADAEKAVEEAKQADQAAKDALAKANEDGLITPAEKAELEKLQEEAQAKKDEATDKVNALPEDQKGDLPAELDKLTGIEVPEVNDADSNGVADDVDAQRADAEKAVEEAKAADQAAKDALAKAQEDGLITPAEKAELEKLQDEAQAKKDEATDKVNALPEDQKGDLPSELDKLTGIEIPEVNDADANGVADDVDAQRADAEKAVEEAKAADQAAKDALAKAEEDGLITPAEKAELEAAAQEAADKKAAAEEKVNALPEDQKGDLPSEIDKLTGIEIPEVNDADANGVADDVDAQREEAEKAVEEAKAADQAAKDALAKAEEDGLITPAEKAELEKLQEEAQAKKDEATDKVNALPEDQKGDLPSELDKLTGIEIPEVNDADANGVADDIDAQRADAEKAVEEAKQADQAAKDALAKANEDGLITPAEKAELEAAAKEVADKKAAAEEKVNALPENQKGDLPSELDKLTGIEIPEANDADSNGVADDVDAQREEAEKAVEEAKAADQAAKDALAKANEDGLITPAEKAELEKLQEEAQAKKDEATDKVNTLPEDQRGDLPAELDKLTGIEIPEVNDADSNGVADDVDAQREEAEKAVEEAKQADQAAKDALVKAEEDGLITPAEKAELETAAQEAADKKSTATEKVNALPEDQKGDLPAELDKLTGIEIPEVNDADSNDVADDVDAQRADAEKAVEEAKAADQAAKDALAKAEEDGLITPAEKAELEALAKEAADKKAAAEEKVNALPEDQKGDLPTELDKLTGIEIPEVNDADANGVADDVDAQRADAEKAVEEAKAADQAAKDALAKAEEDGLITPAEKAELEKLQEEAQAKKDEATDKVNALPESQKGDLPTELDKLTGIEVPEVNDADSNGVADDVDAQRADAEKAVEEAKAADQAAKDALAKANEDGLITPAEKAELEALAKEAADKKATATDKVNALPEDQRGDLPSELAKLTGIEVPEVTNTNTGDTPTDQVDTGKQQEPKAPVNSPVMPKETSDNTTDVTMATGKVTETKPETQHKSQNNKVLPETGQESQQTTLFGSLFAGLGALLFFRRRKNEEEESK